MRLFQFIRAQYHHSNNSHWRPAADAALRTVMHLATTNRYGSVVSLEQIRLDAGKRPLNFSFLVADAGQMAQPAMNGRWRESKCTPKKVRSTAQCRPAE
jgi:hypothetical protein